MGLWKAVVMQRDRTVLAMARHHLSKNEEVLVWARAKEPAGRRTGFAYLTRESFIVHWAGESEGHVNHRWGDIQAWGFNPDTSGGPILGVESSEGVSFVQMPSLSKNSAKDATDLLRKFAELAPETMTPLSETSQLGRFEAHGEADIQKQRRSVAGQSKRIIVTVLGSLLVVLGIILSLPLVPGPGLLTIIAGLAVLSSEYDWAQDVLQWAKEKYREARSKIKKRQESKRTSG